MLYLILAISTAPIIIGVIAFKEKLKIKDYIGILIIIAALILLNI